MDEELVDDLLDIAARFLYRVSSYGHQLGSWLTFVLAALKVTAWPEIPNAYVLGPIVVGFPLSGIAFVLFVALGLWLKKRDDEDDSY